MNGMTKIMTGAKGKINAQEMQKNMMKYTTEKERMQAMNEMINDGMDMDEDIDDTDVDNLIGNMEADVTRKNEERAMN